MNSNYQQSIWSFPRGFSRVKAISLWFQRLVDLGVTNRENGAWLNKMSLKRGGYERVQWTLCSGEAGGTGISGVFPKVSFVMEDPTMRSISKQKYQHRSTKKFLEYILPANETHIINQNLNQSQQFWSLSFYSNYKSSKIQWRSRVQTILFSREGDLKSCVTVVDDQNKTMWEFDLLVKNFWYAN